jgi:acetate kinase
MHVLVLNAGSSSQKSSLYDIEAPLPEHAPAPLWEGKIDWGRGRDAEFRIRAAGRTIHEKLPLRERAEFIDHLLRSIWTGPHRVLTSPEEIALIGHRVVHGGDRYWQPVRITSEVEQAIERLADFAPVHNPANLEGVRACRRLIPHAQQVAVFDTAFHHTLPPAACVYPGPYAWFEHGIRRYGFHGISHESAAHRAATLLQRPLPDLRLITCHLGNGCSLAAVSGGVSVDTTMGFTPLEGLMMGNRSGSVDPGILVYLLRHGSVSADELDVTLNRRSGLLGVSGVSEDMREVLKAADAGNTRASLALDIYVHRLRQAIAAMAASLAGVDAIVFTGGVGENAPVIRSRAGAGLGFLGVRLDEPANRANGLDGNIAAPDSAVAVLIVAAQEDWAIAAAAWRLWQGA